MLLLLLLVLLSLSVVVAVDVIVVLFVVVAVNVVVVCCCCCCCYSGKKVMFSRCLSVCLSVCLLATSLQNYRFDLHENFSRDVFVVKEELVKFWRSYASISGYRNFLKDSSTL